MSGEKIQLAQATPELSILKMPALFEGVAAMELEAPMLEALSRVKTPAVWLDFTDIAYIDSAAIAVLLSVVKAAAAKNRSLSLFQAQENVKKVLAVTRIDKIIPIV